MPRKHKSLLNDLSTGDLKRLLAARERIDVLETERQRLAKELARVEKELGKLLAGGGLESARGRKKGKAVKKTGRKKAAVRKAAGTGKAAAKSPRRKKAGRKGSPRVKLEDVVLAVLKQNGGPMNFKELYLAIVDGKLFKSKSKNFDNVLRRTLSTSKAVKRVSRGVYNA